MPVVVLVGFLADGRSVYHVVVRRFGQHRVEPAQKFPQQLRQARVERWRHILKRRTVLMRQDPSLKRETRRIRRQRYEVIVLENYPRLGVHFLTNNVAENTAFLLIV